MGNNWRKELLLSCTLSGHGLIKVLVISACMESESSPFLSVSPSFPARGTLTAYYYG